MVGTGKSVWPAGVGGKGNAGVAGVISEHTDGLSVM